MNFFVFVFCGCLLLAGCAKTKPAEPLTSSAKPKASVKTATKKKEIPNDKPVITPDDTPSGKVMFVNQNARFVVIQFPNGNVPPTGRRLSVYRNELKVGELKVTGPQQDDNTVANIIAGEAQAKDEVREK